MSSDDVHVCHVLRSQCITILKRRFGNKQLIINRHMETLLHISSVKSGLSGNTQPLRQLYDLIESQVRSLNSLGVSSNSYGSPLSTREREQVGAMFT